MRDKFPDNNGSILVMSLLVLSSMIIVGVSIATITLNELKKAKNSDHSVVAYYAADSVIESSLYRLKKLDLAASYLNENYSSGVFSNSAEWENNIAPTLNYNALLRKNRSAVINLYGEDQSCDSVKCVEVIWNDLDAGESDPDLEATFYPWRLLTGQINVFPEKGEQEYYRSVPENQISAASIAGPWRQYKADFFPGTCYSLRVKPLYDDADFSLKVYSDDACASQTGIPSFLTIDALGRYENSKQRIKAVMLKDAPLNSVFEFVLFSEAPIIKN